MKLRSFLQNKKGKLLIPAALLLVAVFFGVLIVTFLTQVGMTQVQEIGESTVESISRVLENEINDVCAAAELMSSSPGILPQAFSPSAENIEKANVVLDRYNKTLRFSVSYFLDPKGDAVASSNRNDPDSFVGQNYAFRPYFQEALLGKGSFYMAQGITSKELGLYGSYPIKDKAGKVLGALVIKKDVRAIDALLSGYDHFFYITPEGVIFMAGNQANVLKSLWPVSKGQVLALNESRQFSQDSFESLFPQPVLDGDTVKLAGKSFKCFRRPLGPRGWSLVFLAPLKGVFYFRSFAFTVSFLLGAIILVVMMWISRNARARDLLRESEERFRGAFDAAPIGMVLMGLNGRWLKVNKTVCEIMGYPERDLLKKKFQEITHPDDLQSEYLNLRRLMSGEIQGYQMEKRYFHKNGNLIWTLAGVSLVRDKKGAPLYFVSQIEDVTLHKKDSEKLAEKIKELERFNKVAVARELKMIELKEKIKTLEQEKDTA